MWAVGGELSAPVPRSVGAPPESLGAEAVIFPSASGSLIHGWYAPGSTKQGAVLLLHGVRGDRRDMLSRAEFLHGLHYSVLLIDFQALFILSGTRDQHTTIEEARAIFAAAHAPKTIWEVDGAAHVNLYSYAKADYEQRVAAFLAAYLR